MSLRTVEQFYEIGRLLGSGGFAEVRVGTHRQTKEQVAVKIIDKKAMAAIDEESLRREIQILQMVQHPNIVTYRDCFETEAKVYLVMELLEGGELLYQVGKRTSGGAQSYTEDDARHLMLQILSAIAYLHSRGIVHRDLKPENLLFKDKTPQSPLKLCDFGLSSFVTDKNAALTQWCGTPDFTAPEVINQKGYDQQVDMWSAGVILYLLLSGTLPFQDNNTLKVYQKIRKGQYDMSGGVWEIISAEAKDLIAHMLMVEPSQRITAQQALQHMWMTQTTSSVRPLPVAELRSSLTTVQSQRKLKIVGASIIAEGQRRNPSDIAPEADNVNTRSMQQYLPAWQNQARATTMPTAPIRTGTTTNTNAHDKATDTRTNAARKLPLPPSSLSAAKKEKRAAATVLGACNNENTTISLSGSRTPSNYISVGAAAKKKISVPKESLPVRRNRRARVLWSFTGRTERELSVSAGDEVEIEEEQTEWVLAVRPSAPRHGWIPANYVTFLS
jgi:serine/threonine protein kinase